MKRRFVTHSQVERLLTVQARAQRQALPEDFTRTTMAAVRIAKARQHQHSAPAMRPTNVLLAAFALAGLTIIASLSASLLLSQSTTSRTPLEPGGAAAERQDVPRIDLPSFEVAAGSDAISEALAAPFRSEAEALIETGRDVGSAMLSALPARPRTWTERLSDQPAR